MTPAVQTRERLVRAAQEELIRSHGHLEMQAIAKRAHVSVGLAYHHFGSKAGLIAAVVEGFYSRLEEEVFNDTKRPSESWAEERRRVASYIAFHYDHPFAPLVIGALSRAPEVLDVERAFPTEQLAGGARMLEAAQRDGFVPDHIDPHLAIALMIGGIRQALIGALMSQQRPDPGKLTDEIWAFMAGALRLTAGPASKKRSRQNRLTFSNHQPNAEGVCLVQPSRLSRAAIVLHKGRSAQIQRRRLFRPGQCPAAGTADADDRPYHRDQPGRRRIRQGPRHR